MKYLKIRNIISGIFLLAAFASCRPDVDEFVLQEESTTTQAGKPLADSILWHLRPTASSPVNQLFDALEVPFSTTTVNFATIRPNVTIELRTPDDVLISIPSTSVIIGGTIASPNGIVTFKYRSLLKKGDFVRSTMATMSNGLPLVSGGSVQVLATFNGQSLVLASNSMRIRIPAINNQGSTQMQFFTADSTRDVNWQLQDTSRVNLSTWIDSLRQPSSVVGYDCFSNRFRWVNCDYFWNVTPRGRACVSITDTTYNPQNTAIFAVFTNANVVMRLPPVAADRMWCSQNVPLEQPVTYVTLTKIDNNYFLGTRHLPNGAGISPVTTIAPTQRTLQEIVAYLATL